MKSYKSFHPVYGQSLAGKIVYYQKMGVAQGIKDNVLILVRNNYNIADFYNVINNVRFLSVVIVIPTPDDLSKLISYPAFTYNHKRGYIDMIHIDDEVSFHMMRYDNDDDCFVNAGWHTIREGLNLEDTCTLFEYIEDRLEELIVLSPEDRDKYNAIGALGIGC